MICPKCYPGDSIDSDGNAQAGYRGMVRETILAQLVNGVSIRKCSKCGYEPVKPPPNPAPPIKGASITVAFVDEFKTSDKIIRCSFCNHDVESHYNCGLGACRECDCDKYRTQPLASSKPPPNPAPPTKNYYDLQLENKNNQPAILKDGDVYIDESNLSAHMYRDGTWHKYIKQEIMEEINQLRSENEKLKEKVERLDKVYQAAAQVLDRILAGVNPYTDAFCSVGDVVARIMAGQLPYSGMSCNHESDGQIIAPINNGELYSVCKKCNKLYKEAILAQTRSK